MKEVRIDIKPDSDKNPVNCKAKNSVIPVSVLTTEDFDATTIDSTTVLFKNARPIHKQRHEEDVDGDGDIDLVLHFRLDETSLTCDSREVTLIGRTLNGDMFTGADFIDPK